MRSEEANQTVLDCKSMLRDDIQARKYPGETVSSPEIAAEWEKRLESQWEENRQKRPHSRPSGSPTEVCPAKEMKSDSSRRSSLLREQNAFNEHQKLFYTGETTDSHSEQKEPGPSQ